MSVALHARRLAALGAGVTTRAVQAGLPWLRTAATRAERHATLAGDGVIDRPRLVSTRAVTVAAPAGDVWPWLARIGSAIAEGDGSSGFHVVELIPGHAVVVRATVHPVTGMVVDRARCPRRPWIDCSWAFVVTPSPSGRSRLLVRVRYDHSPDWRAARTVDAYEVVDARFSRRVLAAVRGLGEGASADPAAAWKAGGPRTPCSPTTHDGVSW
jgi:hypothetical protein